MAQLPAQRTVRLVAQPDGAADNADHGAGDAEAQLIAQLMAPLLGADSTAAHTADGVAVGAADGPLVGAADNTVASAADGAADGMTGSAAVRS